MKHMIRLATKRAAKSGVRQGRGQHAREVIAHAESPFQPRSVPQPQIGRISELSAPPGMLGGESGSGLPYYKCRQLA